jgi:hypothetical protein
MSSLPLVLPALGAALPQIEFDDAGYGNGRVEWVLNSRNGGGPYDPEGWGYPFRIVLHTIQGNAEGTTIRNHKAPPHLWYNPATRYMWQTVPLSRASFALWQGSGGTHYTNAARALQVELHGYSPEVASEWPQEWLDNITVDLIVPLCRWVAKQGASINLLDAPEPGPIPGSAADDAPQRFSEIRWATFNGLCSHRHVWSNGDRWDTGALDTPRIAQHAAMIIAGAIEQTGDDDMASVLMLVEAPGDPLDGSIWAVDGMFKRHVATMAEVEWMWAQGLAKKVGTEGWERVPVSRIQPFTTIDEWSFAAMPERVAQRFPAPPPPPPSAQQIAQQTAAMVIPQFSQQLTQFKPQVNTTGLADAVASAVAAKLVPTQIADALGDRIDQAFADLPQRMAQAFIEAFKVQQTARITPPLSNPLAQPVDPPPPPPPPPAEQTDPPEERTH